MKKILLTLVVGMTCLVASAVPAIPTPQKVTQPDGTELTVRIKGDEFYGYLTTLDGYTIVKNDNGYYTYGTLVNDEVVASKIVARDEQQRNASDKAWLEKTGKFLKSAKKVEEGRKLRAQRDALPGLKAFNYNDFHGLVILVEFKDSHFTRSDVKDFYTHMINDENYTGYTNEDGSANPYGNCTGSVRDYFFDNSNGVFAPQFDVVGPYEVNFSVDEGNAKATQIFRQAALAANNDVDYSQYDLDGDGNIDLVYFIVADSPSSSDSSHPNHLWPHRSVFGYPRLKYDGKYLNDYACSAEYVYAKANGIFDGIGTICHEFSHVLGLPDLYDTNQNDNATNGEAQHPGEWDLMAGGNYQDNARTPVAYSLYDRYSTGFANYQVITSEGDYELNPIGTTGEGYILKSPQNKEIFLIENRQPTKWDRCAPGHGMMVARVDSTNASVWTSNAPNGNATRLYYELLRAGGLNNVYKSGAGIFNSASDAFPGTSGVPMITNNTAANFLTYTKKENAFNLCDIREENGVIKFKVVQNGSLLNDVEDFEVMPASTDKNTTNAQGTLATWTLMNCHAESVASGHGKGSISVAMKKSSTLTMTSDINNNAYLISFDIYNPTNTDAKFKVFQSVNQGSNWKALKNLNKTEIVTVPKGGKATIFYPIDESGPSRFRLSYSTGSASDLVYVDDVRFYYNENDVIPGDVNGDGECTASDVTALYNYILYNDDSKIVNGDQNSDGQITASDVTAVYNIILGL